MADENDPGTNAGARAEASSDTMFNLARAAKGAALLCFVLPFVTVSCAGQTIGQITGVQLATGSVGQIGQNMPGAPAGGGAAAGNSLDVFALGAALLIIAGLVATFLLARRRASMIAMACAALAALLLVFDVFVRIKGAVADRVRESGSGASSPSAAASEMEKQMQQQMQQQMEQMTQQISVNPAIGFWICILALIAAIVLFNMVRSRRADL